MTQEEYEREQQEIEYLINAINALVDENNRLVYDINEALENIGILQRNIVSLHKAVEPRFRTTSLQVSTNSEHTQIVSQAIRELSQQYFTYKTLSTASKNVTQYTEEYYTKFSYYNHLRRITLGYVIGLDSNFVSAENMRKAVEKAYLQNTDYWLAYATMALMLWASDEKEAAGRALEKALFMDPQKSALYFMLINLRFSRVQTAQNWFVNYMDRVNPSNLGGEWQYLLQAYLAGAFGADEDFQAEVGRQFNRLLAQSEAVTADFSKRFIDRAYAHADAYLHQTREHFPYLKGVCTDYDLLRETLSEAEKNAALAGYYDRLFNEKDDRGIDVYQRIENVLYALINDYDADERRVVETIKLNEYIMEAQGDTAAARRKFDEEFWRPENRTFADLLSDWAFVEDSNITPLTVRHFAVSCMKKWMYRGYEKYAQMYRSKVKPAYSFDVDGCQLTCSEDDFAVGKDRIDQYYQKRRLKTVLADKMVKIYGMIGLAGILLLLIMGIQLAGGSFSPVALTVGILLVLLGVFMFWRQTVSVLEELKERQRLNIQRFQHAIEELGQWRSLFEAADAGHTDLQAALSQFGSIAE